jgi:hypothetical protein
MKKKDLNTMARDKFPSTALGVNQNGKNGGTPGVFVKLANKRLTGYGK